MEYRDNSKEKVITKKDLNGMVWRSLLLQASFNYERMQAGGWLYSILPGLKKIHKNKEDLSNSMKLHLEFFNVHPFLVTFVQGLVLAMEENKESQDSIRGIKIALMGPLGGIGDALFWFTLLPITASIGVSLAKDGNIAGPIVFLILFNIIHIFLRFFLMHYSYKMGVEAIAKLKDDTIGGINALFVNLKIATVINLGNNVMVNIQQDVFDKIVPNILPLLYTLFMFYLLKKGKKPITLILFTLVIGIAGRGFGIL